jgi:uncharacterized protein (TIGR03435 family)
MRRLFLLLPLLFLPNRDSYGAAAPTYEVASVKPNTSSSGMIRFMGPPQSATFTATNATLQILITLAYQVKTFQLEGANGWIGTDHFDISAKPPEGPVTREQSWMMLQALLEDRFKLAVHRTTKEVPIYALTAAKGGLKIKPASEDACFKFVPGGPPPPPPTPGGRPPIPCGGFMMGPGILQGASLSMSQLTDGLTNILGRPVVDKTGFTGTFDVRLEFSREGTQPMGAAGFGTPGAGPISIPDNNGPTIFTALQEQLGLKLESQKGPADFLVIDHAEKPSEN